MSTGLPKRKKPARGAGIQLTPGAFNRLREVLQRRDVLARIGACALAAFFLWWITGSWRPPFGYRQGDVPPRAVTSRVKFSTVDNSATHKAREAARQQVARIYENNPAKLEELLEELKGKVLVILKAKSFNELEPTVRSEFFDRASPKEPARMEDPREDIFDNFRLEMESDADLMQFEPAVKRAMADQLADGLLDKLRHQSDEGDLAQIRVRREGTKDVPRLIEVKKVRVQEVLPEIQRKLEGELKNKHISEPVHFWLAARLNQDFATLQRTKAADIDTAAEAEKLAHDVQEVKTPHQPGEVLAEGGKPLLLDPKAIDDNGFALLRQEHDARVAQLGWPEKIANTLADFGMYLAMAVLCGSYIYFRQSKLLSDWRKYVSLLGLMVTAITLAWIMKTDQWRAEAIPLVLFAMTAAIAYRGEIALLLSGAVCLIFTVSSGLGLAEFTMLLATMSAAILLLGRIRSRTKLIYVGLAAGVVAVFTSLGVGMLTDHNIGMTLVPSIGFEIPVLLKHSLWLGACAAIAGLLMTGLLPFVESIFDVQTDISLLELGDAAHPLLQELVRRAPGTYNHSINVASLAEAAADAIGANGLLCRVGAYFHDIGKMLKPGYFAENQGLGDNRHEALPPTMSTLVIIAHVKDGADLARQHSLPQAIIDFIQQHHGTTVVEYFFRRASEQQKEHDPEAAELEETDFRYPGPKPQTREAGVLMLADAVESTCRTLVEPTPARITGVVETIAQKRLMDGQFDESGLTLSEVRAIQDSLVKSLTAVYHGRVKYPDQQVV